MILLTGSSKTDLTRTLVCRFFGKLRKNNILSLVFAKNFSPVFICFLHFPQNLCSFFNFSKTPFLFFSLFEVLDDDLEGDGFPQSVIILVGRFNAKDAQDADRYAEEMHRAGVHISMIGVVPTVEQKQLDKVADFSYVFDITQGIPANIQDIITQANGC